MNAPQKRRASFAEVSGAEALARARELVPALRERAARAEVARNMLPETEADLHRTGLFRILQPKRYGGMELDYIWLIDVPAELARGCASTAWTVGNYAIHHHMLAQYDERAQEEVWGSNPDAKIASGIAYPQGRARKVDGGYVISGHWNFSSGVVGADWNMLAVLVRDGERVVDHRMCLVPPADYEIVDDWQVLGMRATGSQSVRAKDVFVPEHRALCMYACRGGAGFPGAKVNPNPMFRIPVSTLGSHCLAPAALGNAQAALELTCDAVKARSTNYTAARMRDFQTVQLRVGAAGARIEAARLLFRQDCIEAQRMAAADHVPTVEEKLRIKRNVAYGAQLCTEAVDLLHAMAGANGIYDTYPIQRVFRDAHSLMAHIGFAFDAHGSAWGLVALGGEFASPTL
ncbi:MAG: acyl-CoA dehydrogenase family protein [Burkholderiales bacterium]|nr:acyl-CoA dehydrogenase family protein [Burkholderiales bacterium]